jgi:hypothetical protein
VLPNGLRPSSHSGQSAAAAALAQHLAEINKEADRLTDVGHRERVAEFAHSAPAKAADAAVTIARQRREQAAQAVEDIRRQVSTLSETPSSDRAIARAEKRLAHADNAVAVGQQLIADARDSVELANAIEAIDGHAHATGTDADWLNTALAAKVPALTEAIEAEQQAAKVQAVVEVNATRLHTAIVNGQALRVPLTEI